MDVSAHVLEVAVLLTKGLDNVSGRFLVEEWVGPDWSGNSKSRVETFLILGARKSPTGHLHVVLDVLSPNGDFEIRSFLDHKFVNLVRGQTVVMRSATPYTLVGKLD